MTGRDGIVHAAWDVPLHGGDTYRLWNTPFVFTVPREGSWKGGAVGNEFVAVAVQHLETAAVAYIDRHTGTEDASLFAEESYAERARQATTAEERDGYRLVGEVLESVKYAPEDPELWVVIEGEGEMLLRWKPLRGATRWEYRVGEGPPPGASDDIVWGEWLPLSAAATSLRLFMEPRDEARHFEVRPWTREGPGEPRTVSLPLGVPGAASDGVPQMSRDALHAGGRTWGRDAYIFDVPADMLLRFRAVYVPHLPAPSYLEERLLLMDEASGSYVLIRSSTGELLEHVARPHPRGVDTEAMLLELLDSMQE